MAVTRPTIERRQLGMELRRLRTSAGLSQKDVAAVIDYDVSSISRLERGERTLQHSELQAVVDFFGLTDSRRDELLDLGRRARARQRRRMYSDPLSGAFRRLSDLEEMAAEISYSSGELIPGLLQTEDYIRCLMRTAISVAAAGDNDLEARVRFRLERQQLLERASPPAIWFVIGEPALRRPVGGYRIQKEQLHHIHEVIGRYPQVTVQVVPLSVADHPMLDGSMMLARFAGQAPDIVHQSTFSGGGVYIDDDASVAECFRAYDWLRAVALGPAESEAFILARAEELVT